MRKPGCFSDILMYMLRVTISILLVLLLAAPLSGLGCGSGTVDADRMVNEADVLRLSAVEKFRKSTASVDNLVRGAAAGQALPVNQTKQITDEAVSELNDALAELSQRDDKIISAGQQQVSATYQDYLNRLTDSNESLRQTMRHSMAIPILLGKEQYSLAGWDEIKAQTIVNQVTTIQLEIERLYNESETMRNQAEQMRQDNPEAFE